MAWFRVIQFLVFQLANWQLVAQNGPGHNFIAKWSCKGGVFWGFQLEVTIVSNSLIFHSWFKQGSIKEPMNAGQFVLRPRTQTFQQLYWTFQGGDFNVTAKISGNKHVVCNSIHSQNASITFLPFPPGFRGCTSQMCLFAFVQVCKLGNGPAAAGEGSGSRPASDIFAAQHVFSVENAF